MVPLPKREPEWWILLGTPAWCSSTHSEKCVVASPTAAIFSPGGSTPTHPVEHHLVLPPGLQAAHTAQGVQNSTVLASHQGSRPTVPP